MGAVTKKRISLGLICSNLLFIIGLLINGCDLHAQNCLWAKSLSGTNYEHGLSVDVDGSGNVYSTGYFDGPTDFDPNAGIYNLTPVGYSDAYVSKLNSSGNHVWTRSFGSFNGAIGSSIALDASGNIYTTGAFLDTVDFDPGPGIFNLISPSSLNESIFILKLDPSGNFVWAKSFTSKGGSSSGASIFLDAIGNVYTTGYFSDTLDCNPGPAVFNLIPASAFSGFISKLDANGNFVWARGLTGASAGVYVFPSSITVDLSGNVITTGRFDGTVDFDPGVSISNLTCPGAYDAYISKLDASGNFVWAKNIGGAGNGDVRGKSITTDATGNVYVCGSFAAAIIDFDPGPGNYTLSPVGSFSLSDAFVLKLNSSGNFGWVKNFGTIGGDYANSVVSDGIGNVYTTGYFEGSIDFDPGPGTYSLTTIFGNGDGFISKLDAAGNFIFAKQISGTSGPSRIAWPSAICLDGAGGFYITGYYTGQINCNVGGPAVILSSAGYEDVMIGKYSGGSFTEIKEPESFQEINVFPNPTINEFQINLKGEKFEKSTLEIFNNLGEKVYTSILYSQTEKINVSGFSSGVYFLRLTNSATTFNTKIIVR